MKNIKRVGRINPRGQLLELGITLEQYDKLRDGQSIEVSDDAFIKIKGIVETDETIVLDYKTYSKPKDKKKKTKSKARPQHQFDADESGLYPKKEEEGLTSSETYKSFQTEND